MRFERNATPDASARLSIAATSTNTLVISWPTNAIDFVLQKNLACDTANRADATNAVSVIDGGNRAVVSTPLIRCFYRLFSYP